MSAALLNILVSMTLCFAAWGIFYNFLHRRGVDYTRHFLWTAGYFLSVALVVSLIFWQYIAPVLRDFALTPLIVLGIFTLIQTVLYVYLPKYLRAPAEYFEKYPDRYYLKIDWRRLVSKSMDILAQQVFIVLLVIFLKNLGLPLYQILLYFGILFALLHVPLIASEYPRWPAWLFAAAVVGFSVVFPLTILYVPYGFVYNYMIHWLFYVAVAVSFWVRYNHSR